MSYNTDDYTTRNDDQIKFDSHNGFFTLTDNKYLNFIYSATVAAVRWYAWKFILLGIFIVVVALVAGKKTDAFKTADEMSNHAASDGWVQALKEFKKNTDFKSTKANSHPLYNSPIIKAWEQETKLDFTDLYQYIVIKNHDGHKEDLIVMKKAAFDIEDTDKKTLDIEYSTMFVDDAEDVCDAYFGAVPTDYQKSFYDRKRHWSIRKIKGEVTQENDDKGKFRCVINHETIQDLIED